MRFVLLVFVPPVTLVLAAWRAGPLVLLPGLVMFGLVPLFDHLLSLDTANRPRPAALRWLPHAFAPAHLAALAYALWRVSTGELGVVEQGLLTVGAGLATAAAINAAHELMHRPGRLDQRLAEVLMATASYTHFCVEHVQGHHKNVGTPLDPATALAVESLYAYLPRTLLGGLRSAWAIARVRGRGGLQNRLVRYALAQGLLLAAVGASPAGVAEIAARAGVEDVDSAWFLLVRLGANGVIRWEPGAVPSQDQFSQSSG